MKSYKEFINENLSSINFGEDFDGYGWRVDYGFTHEKGKTAGDVIRWEQDEVGNDLRITESQIKQLDMFPANRLNWYTYKKKDAFHYGTEPEKYKLSGKIISNDGDDGGFLILIDQENNI